MVVSVTLCSFQLESLLHHMHPYVQAFPRACTCTLYALYECGNELSLSKTCATRYTLQKEALSS